MLIFYDFCYKLYIIVTILHMISQCGEQCWKLWSAIKVRYVIYREKIIISLLFLTIYNVYNTMKKWGNWDQQRQMKQEEIYSSECISSVGGYDI